MAQAAPCAEDAEHGFSRPEMFSEALAGTCKDKVDRFVALISGKADDWPADLKDLPGDSLMKQLQGALKKAGLGLLTKVVLAEAADGDAEGDVLVFPGALRINVLRDGRVAAEPLIEAMRRGDRASCGADVEDCHAFVCAHANRDARCGYCGPRLVDAIKTSASGVHVRKCSHVGGHAYAGNVLVFKGGQGDFYGYVTPQRVGETLSGAARFGRCWRGALGLTPEACARARRAKLVRAWAAPIALAAATTVAALWLLRRRRQPLRNEA
mmetsp:Transcript_54264/g.150965  ORF Transcript_54264/g.150965 Transcript_54264/m.150965 type:complete len:268 (-) Transcript_54264:210-1013(-)